MEGAQGGRSDDHVLERAMDRMDADLPEMRNFILPGGHAAIPKAHICRTGVPGAERRLVELARRRSFPGGIGPLPEQAQRPALRTGPSPGPSAWHSRAPLDPARLKGSRAFQEWHGCWTAAVVENLNRGAAYLYIFAAVFGIKQTGRSHVLDP